MSRIRALALALLALGAACGDDDDEPAQGGTIAVMTRNLFLGAGLEPIIFAPSAAAVPGLVSTAFAQAQASNFPERAKKLADEIAAARPDVVGLQEVSLYRLQTPGDFQAGNPVQATQVALDFLEILRGELAARGLAYAAVATSTNFDAEFPDAAGNDLRFTDRDVILARQGVETFEARDGRFASRIPLPPIGGAFQVSLPRGWTSVGVRHASGTYRFVNTHLEAVGAGPLAPFQEAQASELLALLAGDPLPIVLAGDFNSNANQTTTQSYAILRGAGFQDAWSVLQPGDPGLTCCHEVSLTNPAPTFETRIDLVLYRGAFTPVSARISGADPAQRTATPVPLWPSDHAGVSAVLRAP